MALIKSSNVKDYVSLGHTIICKIFRVQECHFLSILSLKPKLTYLRVIYIFEKKGTF